MRRGRWVGRLVARWSTVRRPILNGEWRAREGTAGMSTPFRIATDAEELDIRLLHYRDRAVLRILDRAEAATPRQLAILVYGHLRVAQGRLLRLWQDGLLERATVPHAQRGGAELAYRRVRGGSPSRRRSSPGANRLGHTLDSSRPLRARDSQRRPTARLAGLAWLAEPNAAAVLGTPPYPTASSHSSPTDGRASSASRSTRPPSVEPSSRRSSTATAGSRCVPDLVAALRRAITDPSTLAPIGRRPGDERVAARAWVTSLTALQLRHLDAPVRALADGRTAIVRELAHTTDGCRTSAPVGSESGFTCSARAASRNWMGSSGSRTGHPHIATAPSRTAPASGSSPPPVMSRRKGRCPSRSTFPTPATAR